MGACNPIFSNYLRQFMLVYEVIRCTFFCFVFWCILPRSGQSALSMVNMSPGNAMPESDLRLCNVPPFALCHAPFPEVHLCAHAGVSGQESFLPGSAAYPEISSGRSSSIGRPNSSHNLRIFSSEDISVSNTVFANPSENSCAGSALPRNTDTMVT